MHRPEAGGSRQERTGAGHVTPLTSARWSDEERQQRCGRGAAAEGRRQQARTRAPSPAAPRDSPGPETALSLKESTRMAGISSSCCSHSATSATVQDEGPEAGMAGAAAGGGGGAAGGRQGGCRRSRGGLRAYTRLSNATEMTCSRGNAGEVAVPLAGVAESPRAARRGA